MNLVPVLFPLLYVIQIAGIAAKPSPYRWMFFLPIAVIATFLVFRTDSVETTSFFLLVASDYLLLTDVQRELRLIGQPKSISDAPLSDRLIWAVKLITTPRGIGWAHEPTAVLPPRPNLTRGQFIILQVKRLVFYALLLDVGQMITRNNPPFHSKTAPPMAEQGVLWCSYAMLNFLIQVVSTTTIVQNLIPSLVLVTAGLSEPSEWPPAHGSWFDAYTIHNFWWSVKFVSGPFFCS